MLKLPKQEKKAKVGTKSIFLNLKALELINQGLTNWNLYWERQAKSMNRHTEISPPLTKQEEGPMGIH